MTKLDQNVAAQIAEAVNAVTVAKMMRKEAETLESKILWADAESEAVIKLADEFGIELPTLEMARERMGKAA